MHPHSLLHPRIRLLSSSFHAAHPTINSSPPRPPALPHDTSPNRFILCSCINSTPHIQPSSTTNNPLTAITMFGFKLLAVAALACAVVATDSACAAPTTVTVTMTECVTAPVNPLPTRPGSHVPPVAPPPSSVESTATAPLSSNPPEAPTNVMPPPPGVPSSGTPVAPPSSGAPVAPSTGVAPHSTPSVTGTVPAPSSTAANNRPSPSTSTPAVISTAAAALATPYIKLGSLVAAGAAAMAVAV
ncbi:uncharacterized protein K460DRAFT_418751 [Cucurbitaria berberidis CBS 394.84]|uniref:Uncharacterized protein n=1 Tax=Cucurbitaria berberidis CBS 394.84 TaxID=1168544 RepID=A0A9P4GD66_9PLEO|nr:uncharacterized protein K460DRAFT_418751 [Cucurbitaria berberidis CBS 394.84]KAF1843748.1 hypothetical protein K460DRAFT_418751 [Cucurbitaria berberidis CBS 394.84]